MEVVYFYDPKFKKDVDALLEDEFFKRLGASVRDASLMGTKRKEGFYLYIKAENPEKMKTAESKIVESKIALTKLSGEEEKQVLDAIHAEEEAAASGMGAIFG
jgi:uncharacterized membrane protein